MAVQRLWSYFLWCPQKFRFPVGASSPRWARTTRARTWESVCHRDLDWKAFPSDWAKHIVLISFINIVLSTWFSLICLMTAQKTRNIQKHLGFMWNSNLRAASVFTIFTFPDLSRAEDYSQRTWRTNSGLQLMICWQLGFLASWSSSGPLLWRIIKSYKDLARRVECLANH